jgi:hypothetical protein
VTVVVFGAGVLVLAGVWLLVGAVVPGRAPLAVAMERLHRTAPPTPTFSGARTWTGRLGDWGLRRSGTWHPKASLVADLAVVGRPVEVHVGKKLLYATAGLVYGPIVIAVAAPLAGVSVPIVVPTWMALVGGAVGWLAPDAAVRSEAAGRRAEFRACLGAWVDVMVLAFAAGEGPEGALHAAAHAGGAWPFREVRRALDDARRRGEASWVALERLAGTFGIAELAELAGLAQLAGRDGAAIRRTLAAKSESLRDHQLAAAEADAAAATSRMRLPVVLMVCGFLLFVGYPAVTQVLSSV